MSRSKIDYVKMNWNVVNGCSNGCPWCYARRMFARVYGADKPFAVPIIQYDRMGEPYGWKTPQWVFVNSLGDTFDKGVPEQVICRMFDIMAETHHQYIVLTKQPERLSVLAPRLTIRSNMYIGVTVTCDEGDEARIETLQKIPNIRRKVISFEPLLGYPEGLELKGIAWVLVGGLHASKRWFEKDYPTLDGEHNDNVRGVITAAKQYNIPVLYKQGCGPHPEHFPMIDGKRYMEYPL